MPRLKRRIEHQIREVAGDKLRSAEVRVVNRKVAIQARSRGSGSVARSDVRSRPSPPSPD